jgi:hypothetical protein
MNQNKTLRRWLASAATILVAISAQAENWPTWRGPNHDAVSSEKNLPVEWSESKNLLWKAPLPGVGAATPAVWGDRIFVTSEEGDDLVLLCFGTDGREQWKAKVGTGAKHARGGEGNGATPSPSTDGKLVFAYVGSGDFVAFDFAGKEIWHFNAQERYGKFAYGFGMHTTPLLHSAGSISNSSTPALPSSSRSMPRPGGKSGRWIARVTATVNACIRMLRRASGSGEGRRGSSRTGTTTRSRTISPTARKSGASAI